MDSLRHLIIDGYNVIHALPQLQAWMLRGDLEIARNHLFDLVKPIHDQFDYRVTLVFDGSMDGKEVFRPTKELTFSVIYAPSSLSADGLIEQLVQSSKQPERITAVTQDHMIQETLTTIGAFTITPEELMDWVQNANRVQESKINRNNYRKSSGQPFGNFLNFD